MNYKSLLCVVAILANSASIALSSDEFKGQPKMSDAYEEIGKALAELEMGKVHKPGHHRVAAWPHLEMAKTYLEQAAKNKGSYRPKARALIDDAERCLKSTPLDEKTMQKGIDILKVAMHEVNLGARTAR